MLETQSQWPISVLFRKLEMPKGNEMSTQLIICDIHSSSLKMLTFRILLIEYYKNMNESTHSLLFYD